MNTVKASYPMDNSSILYLAQLCPQHSNIYRFTVELTETVCPETLQRAADRVCPRFPTIFAGFRPDFFTYRVIPVAKIPVRTGDPGLLNTLSHEEMEQCAYRIFCAENRIMIEAFHACADGYGAVASLRTLVAQYLHLRYELDLPEVQQMLENGGPDWDAELRDSYLDYADAKPRGMPGRYSYQLPGENRDGRIRYTVGEFPTEALLAASHRYGVSMTALLTCLMAESVLEIQEKYVPEKKRKPARIMVPMDLRRLFPSKTMRNFILYALPTLEAEEIGLPREEKLRSIRRQLKEQITREVMGPIIARNVQVQESLAFRLVPRALKMAAMRLAYRFFGESNSSITLTNLGNVALSEQMKPYIKSITVYLTPRRHSPYNCGILSCGDMTRICITRFGKEPELEPLFFGKLRAELNL